MNYKDKIYVPCSLDGIHTHIIVWDNAEIIKVEYDIKHACCMGEYRVFFNNYNRISCNISCNNSFMIGCMNSGLELEDGSRFIFEEDNKLDIRFINEYLYNRKVKGLIDNL